MPSTDKTVNYQLSQFTDTDKPKWTGDYNSDMATIDAQMKANADDQAAHKADTVAHMTQTQKDQLAAAIQSATIGGTAVPQDGTKLEIPMPNAAQVGTSNPNLLINGDFQVWQRGTGFIQDNGNGYCADRWRLIGGGGTGETASKGTNCLTVTHSGTGIWADIFQEFESDTFAKFKGKTVTLSANIDGTIYSFTGVAGAEIFKDFGNFNLRMGTDIYGQVPFACVVRFTDTSAHNIYWVKLEIGSVATLFSPRSYAEELAVCKRYYQKLLNNEETRTVCINGADIYFEFKLPVEMYGVPTISFGAESTNWRVSDLLYSQVTGFSISRSSSSKNSVLFRTTKVGHGLADASFMAIGDGIGLDAEIY